MAYDILWKIHAILMTVSFVSMLTGFIISIAFKKKKWRYRTHKRLGLTAGVSGISALLLVIIMVHIFSGVHFTSLHTIFGGITGLLLIVTPLAGLGTEKVKRKKELKRVHRILGFTTLAMMVVTILLGLSLAGIIYIQ